MKQSEGPPVVIIRHPAGIEAGCARCRSILVHGTLAIGVRVSGRGYIVMSDTARTCCGDIRNVPLLFDNDSRAEHAKTFVTNMVERSRGFSDLRLLRLSELMMWGAEQPRTK